MQLRNLRNAAIMAASAAILIAVAAFGPPAGDAEEKAGGFKVPPKSWPMFGGDQSRNMVNLVERNMPTEFDIEAGKGVLWKEKLGSKAYGGPTISGGKILVGTNNESPRNQRDTKGGRAIDKGVIMCFEQDTGKFLWQAIHDKLPAGLVHDWPREGICSAPVIEGDRAYYVSNQCHVVCVDMNGFANGNQGFDKEKYQTKTDADIIWELDMMADLKVFPHNLAVCSPLVAGDILFVVTSNGVDAEHLNIPSPAAPSFIAMNKKTGELLWKDNAPGRKIMHGQWSNPTYAVIKGVPQVIFPGGDGILYAYTPDTGKLIWKFDCNPEKSVYKLGGRGTRSDFIATPVVYEDKVYIAVGQDPEHLDGVGHLWCIDPTKATATNKDISPKNDNFDPKAAVNKDSGLVWHYGGFEKREGSRREFKFGRTMSTCSIVDDILYIAELNGYVFCMDANTGKKYWHYDLKSGVWGSTYYVDGKVYIGTEDGDLFIFKHVKSQPDGLDEDDYPDRDKKKEVRKKVENMFLLGQVFVDESIRSTPVASGGKLFIMTEQNLIAVK